MNQIFNYDFLYFTHNNLKLFSTLTKLNLNIQEEEIIKIIKKKEKEYYI